MKLQMIWIFGICKFLAAEYIVEREWFQSFKSRSGSRLGTTPSFLCEIENLNEIRLKFESILFQNIYFCTVTILVLIANIILSELHHSSL